MELDGQMGLFAPEPETAEGENALMTADGVTLMRGDCLKLMDDIPAGSVDMILCDLPYGMTECAWDSALPMAPLWAQWRRVAKERAAICLFAAQPFTTELIASNRKAFRYCWYWKKNYVTGGIFSKVQPMRCIEDICVFYEKMPLYRPQGVRPAERPRTHSAVKSGGVYRALEECTSTTTGYPTHLLCFDSEGQPSERVHPTQKPAALLRYLIKTYTRPGEIVLDNCMGSGSTGVAAVQTGRRFIGIEMDGKYFEIARRRIAEAMEGRNDDRHEADGGSDAPGTGAGRDEGRGSGQGCAGDAGNDTGL